MPLQVQYLDQGRGVVFTATGMLTGEEFVRTNAEILSRDLVAEPYLYGLFDFDGVEAVSVSANDIREVASRNVAESVKMPKLVVAVHATSNLTYGLARMWEILVEQSGWTTSVFRDRSEAVAWLKKEVELRFGVKIHLD
jgi:hypothetical protein